MIKITTIKITIREAVAGKTITEQLSACLVAANEAGFNTYCPRHVPAIMTQGQFDQALGGSVIGVGIEEYCPAWYSKAKGFGPQEWCRRSTWIRYPY